MWQWLFSPVKDSICLQLVRSVKNRDRELNVTFGKYSDCALTGGIKYRDNISPLLGSMKEPPGWMPQA